MSNCKTDCQLHRESINEIAYSKMVLHAEIQLKDLSNEISLWQNLRSCKWLNLTVIIILIHEYHELPHTHMHTQWRKKTDCLMNRWYRLRREDSREGNQKWNGESEKQKVDVWEQENWEEIMRTTGNNKLRERLVTHDTLSFAKIL